MVRPCGELRKLLLRARSAHNVRAGRAELAEEVVELEESREDAERPNHGRRVVEGRRPDEPAVQRHRNRKPGDEVRIELDQGATLAVAAQHHLERPPEVLDRLLRLPQELEAEKL